MGARLLLAGCTAITMLGCSFTRIESYTPRTATEQLLVSQAFERAVRAIDLPDLAGRAVAVEMAMMGSGQEFASDAAFAKAMVEAAVGRKGGRIVDVKEAELVVTAIVSTLATNGRSALIGLPEIKSTILGIPEIPLLKVLREKGFARLQLVVRDRDGYLTARAGPVMRNTNFNVYSVFFIAFRSSDIYDEMTVGFE